MGTKTRPDPRARAGANRGRAYSAGKLEQARLAAEQEERETAFLESYEAPEECEGRTGIWLSMLIIGCGQGGVFCERGLVQAGSQTNLKKDRYVPVSFEILIRSKYLCEEL